MLRKSNLRLQLLTVVALACFAILATQVMTRILWTQPQIDQLAEYSNRLDLLRLQGMLAAQLSAMKRTTNDNAVYDDMYTMVRQRNITWFNRNLLIPSSLVELGLNGIYVFDNNQHAIAGVSLDQYQQPVTPQYFSGANNELREQLRETTPTQITGNVSPRSWFTLISQQPAVVLSQPIATVSSSTRDVAGTLVIWRYLDEAFIKAIDPMAYDGLEIHQGVPLQVLISHLSGNWNDESITPQIFQGRLYLGITDMKGALIAALSIPQSPNIRMNVLNNPYTFSSLLITAATLIGFYIFISAKIVSPIRQLLKTVNYVNFSGDYSVRANLQGNNEIHKLGRLIDELFHTVESKRREVELKTHQLQRLSHTDALTGLANRRQFDEYLKQLRRTPLHRQQPLSLLVIDVDFFKRFNDFYGHAKGDVVLQAVAHALQENTRGESDLVCRYGGEEFVVVLQNTHAQAAAAVANKLCKAVATMQIPHQTSAAASYVTISIGVATKPEDQEVEPDILFDWADAALYIAKDKGRNSVEVA